MKSMHKRSATFFLPEIRAGWGAVLCIPVNSAPSPAWCLRLHSVRIDPSALYHIMSYCLLHTFRFLWRLCMCLLSDILVSISVMIWPFSLALYMHWCTLTARTLVLIWLEKSLWYLSLNCCLSLQMAGHCYYVYLNLGSIVVQWLALLPRSKKIMGWISGSGSFCVELVLLVLTKISK